MKVIFLQDVSRVARVGEVKEVADGYGRNFLLPQKLAVLASPGAVKDMGAMIRREASHRAKTEAELAELANQLDGKEIFLKAKVGEKDKLYGSITLADIAVELERATGLVVDKRKIELAEPIRQVGNYEVAIKLGKDLVSQVKVTVAEEAA
ncbi:MAG: 50S ribosomal protein L9 [Dehalococcoidales bacterium]|jgi:large subunit ribosomal protein L9|nr:50S ribosomal protein L9 [Dehalococcoidales bacterium]MDP7109438.1 50S ribosomal protein L9 [Dehalococcoidales bacterium]MDP7309850.1 50S ribosomal protein L9 [Dehalococcoidales bacterium]MDP7409744.1 50S ribosomal protein L9 [Dehalococcoidales bacterium]MDP7676161.1 50S ribosomal protein L9 [Dehalococcoidales bacterium]|tara:strand:+ start:443 stop:895 length:453 start_codon:yes stop_codon:yes gene_type:complete